MSKIKLFCTKYKLFCAVQKQHKSQPALQLALYKATSYYVIIIMWLLLCDTRCSVNKINPCSPFLKYPEVAYAGILLTIF